MVRANYQLNPFKDNLSGLDSASMARHGCEEWQRAVLPHPFRDTLTRIVTAAAMPYEELTA
jgi:hypothetical protein